MINTGICVSCGNYAITDADGQCFSCYKEGKTTDRFGNPVRHLVKKFNMTKMIFECNEHGYQGVVNLNVFDYAWVWELECGCEYSQIIHLKTTKIKTGKKKSCN